MKYLLIAIFGLLNLNHVGASAPTDSVGISKIGNILVIIHMVDKGEGLLAIARRYNVTVDDIKKMNPGLKAPVIGQRINIPFTPRVVNNQADSGKISVDESHANADSKEISSDKKHIVMPGETLSRIAAKYKISVQQLIKWNNIRNNSVTPGQELRVTGYTVIKPYEKWNKINSTSSRVDTPKNILSSEIKLIEELGIPEPSDKVTHPTLPPGTFLLCINPETEKQYLIKVQQNKPLSNKCIIGIPQNILDSLGISVPQSPVLIKYNLP